MAQSVTICYEGPSDLGYLAKVIADKCVGTLKTYPSQLEFTRNNEESVVIKNVRSRELAAEDYFDNEDVEQELRELAPELNYVLIYFRDIHLARWVLEALLGALVLIGNCWVDSDYGWVRRGTWFLDRIERDPNWDWRTKSPPEVS